MGQEMFKRRFLTKWLNSLNRSQQMKEQLVREMLTPVPTLLSTKIVKHSRLSSLDINDLQTDDDLREAHDLLSVKLKDLIAAKAPIGSRARPRDFEEHAFSHQAKVPDTKRQSVSPAIRPDSMRCC